MRSVHLASVIAQSSSGGSAFGLLLPFAIMGVAMYFLLIRPQKRRQRQAAELQQSIEVGDEIMTTSGVYGFITGFDGDIVWLEIDDNVQIRVARGAVQRKVDTAVGETAVPVDDGSGKGKPIEPAAGTAVDEPT